MLQHETYLVVGGAGYIGSHVCKALAQQGAHPVVFDNFSSGHQHAVKWGPYVNVDLKDASALEAAMADYAGRCDGVIHLASSIEVGFGEKQPAEFYNNNVIGAFNLLEGMRKLGMDKLIFSSTCATYGETVQMPLVEDLPQIPQSVYGKTKLAIEHVIQSYHKAYGLSYVTLRYFNAAGADDEGDIGEEHDPETHLIPIAIRAAVGLSDKPMKLFGTDYDTRDGTCVRDYIHVTDIARAHLKSLEAMKNGLGSAELNIGTGKGVTNLEVMKMVEQVTGRPVPYDNAPRRAGDVTQLYANAAKAKEVIGFEPRHSELENIIQTAWNFHKTAWSDEIDAHFAVEGRKSA